MNTLVCNNMGWGIIHKNLMVDTDLSIEAKGIFAYLVTYAGNGNTAFPSRDLICHHLGIGKDRYYRHMKSLQEKGYVTIQQTKSEDGRFNHNVYILNPYPDFTDSVETCNGIKDTNINNINKNNNNNNNKEKASKDDIPYKEIIDYLNEKTGKRFKAVDSNKKLIRARWREKYTLEDFKKVIDVKVEKWLGNDMEEYLRPKTLFASSHFDDYLNEAEKKFKKQEGTSNPNGEYIDKGVGEFGDFAEEWARQMNPDNMFGR